jgi:hypothetical protein
MSQSTSAPASRAAPLANPRLEALRRFAVLVRLFDNRLHNAAIDWLGAAGYSVTQNRAASWQVAAAIRTGERDAQ